MSEKVNSKLTNTDLPEGTVTFLFTDIEGSTKLLKQLSADRYRGLLADQRRLLRSSFKQFNGTEIDTQGDSFFVSFSRATQAVAAVVEIQRALAAYEWPESVDVPEKDLRFPKSLWWSAHSSVFIGGTTRPPKPGLQN